jgi:glutaredoxin-related protein
MLPKETAEQLREIDRMAKREMADVDTDALGTDKIDVSALYRAIDSYAQANRELLQSQEFRNAISAYSDAQDSAEGAISTLQNLNYTTADIEPILTSSVVTESIARLEHDAVPETGDDEIDEAVNDIVDKSTNDQQYQREELIGLCAVVANHLTTKALERHQSSNLSHEEQTAVVLIITFAILFCVTGGVAAITGATASAVGFTLLFDGAEKRAERLDL